jgi:tRNA (cytidine/uridine-2'-O-)-methyltransferase
MVARMRGTPLATRDDLHVVLISPEIPWNTGNAGRTCLAAGAQLHLVEPLGFSLAARAVRRAGLDYWPRVAPRIWPDWAAFERALPELGEPHFFSAEATRPFWSAETSARTVLIFGCESVGLPQEVRARWRDRLVGFPMADPALRSLNLANCVAVAVYDVLRRRAG